MLKQCLIKDVMWFRAVAGPQDLGRAPWQLVVI